MEQNLPLRIHGTICIFIYKFTYMNGSFLWLSCRSYGSQQRKKDRHERGTHLYMEFIGNTADGSEIRRENHLECEKNPVNNGRIYNYQPQLVSLPDFVPSTVSVVESSSGYGKFPIIHWVFTMDPYMFLHI